MAARREFESVTRLLGLRLSPGKLRGLQRISNANGTLTMVALDQNPGTLGRETDQQLQENLRKLDAASERPWVLLSASVDFPITNARSRWR